MIRKETLNAYEKEAGKTDHERAEDLAYTLNHAIACSSTDMIDPLIGKYVQDKIGHWFRLGCGHDHGDSKNGSLGHWFLGEVAGDFGSVPLTIGMQRYAPGFMAAIRRSLEPMLGGIFHASAEKSALRWAVSNKVSTKSKAFHDRMDDLYEHQLDHLPQAVVWTLSSLGINTAVQRMTGNSHSPITIAISKSAGIALTTVGVFGARLVAPKAMRNMDNWTSERIIIPATKFVSSRLGIESSAVENAIARHEDEDTPNAAASTAKDLHNLPKPTLLKLDNITYPALPPLQLS